MPANESPQPSPVNPLRENIAPSTDQIDLPVSPEILVSRLGDYLIEKKLLTPEQLQRALDYQKANAIAGNPRLLGQILVELKFIDRSTLDQVITEQILKLQTALKETNKQLEQRVEERTHALQHRLNEIRTAAEIVRLVTRSTNLDELLNTAVTRVVEQFKHYYAAIFLVDPQEKYVVLHAATGKIGQELKERGYKLAIGSRSIIGWVSEHNQARSVTDAPADTSFLQNELLPQTRSEACVPLSIGEKVVGVLDVQSTSVNAFDEDDVVILQTLADQIASAIRNIRLLENTRGNLQEVNLLYETSHRISQSENAVAIFEHVAQAFGQTTFHMVSLIVQDRCLRKHSASTPKDGYHALTKTEYLPFPVQDMEEALHNQRYLFINDFNQTTLPAVLVHIPRQLKCEEVAYIPVRSNGHLVAVYVLGSQEKDILGMAALQPYVSLAEFAGVTLEKISVIRDSQEQISNLSVLNTISQAISTEIDLERLYSVIHQQIKRLMGEVAFYIAIYEPKTETIQIPYLYEDGKVEALDPIPLGQGLTSIVIREKKPLVLLEDAERKSIELGAKQHGKLAKSWLGVPLMVGGEILGVITVQDTQREHAFDSDDERLLSTMAAQIAVVIRNAQLIAEARAQARRERYLYEATEKIRSSLDLETILETAAQELSRNLKARRITIDFHAPTQGAHPPEENA
ncbi:MAG: hypothetical protein Fur0018_12550 [Anaerolineales bacterium]